MPSLEDIRNYAVESLLQSPFLKKNVEYEKHDARLDADLLLAFLLNISRSHLLAILDADGSHIKDDFEKLIEKRKRGLSLAYIIGRKEFYGMEFYVTPSVLIPKSDTELLVEKAILSISSLWNEERDEKYQKEIRILDVFSGSGCIAIAIAKNIQKIDRVHYTLIDISNEALLVAKKNAYKLLQKNVWECFSFLAQDARQPFIQKGMPKYDIVVANPPYVPMQYAKELLSDGRGEPMLALNGGENGLCFFEALAHNALLSLSEKGILFSEVGDGQAEEVAEICKGAGFAKVKVYKDLAGKDRVIEAMVCEKIFCQ